MGLILALRYDTWSYIEVEIYWCSQQIKSAKIEDEYEKNI